MQYNFAGYIIETDMNIVTIHDLTLDHKLNAHTSLRLKGLLSQETQDTAAIKMTESHAVTVCTQEQENIFCGYVDEITIEKTAFDMVGFELHALSLTHEMDILVKSRTFQDLHMTYRDILQEVTADYAHSDFIASVDVDKPIPHMIVQYKETDWQFILRLASHFNTAVAANAKALKSRFYFGLQKHAEPFVINDQMTAAYSHQKDLAAYIETAQNNHLKLMHWDKSSYTIESYEKLELCQKVIFQNIPLVVTRVQFGTERSLPRYKYTLAYENGTGLSYIKNKNIQGAKLRGIIQEIKRNTARVHFALDPQYKGANNVFIPYSGQENNEQGFYMSVPGSVVEVFFPDSEEKHCFVSAAVRMGDAGSERMNDNREKHFRNDYGREFTLGPQHMEFATGNSIQVHMTGDGHVSLHAPDIIINAEHNVTIGPRSIPDTSEKSANPRKSLPKNIQISAQNKITLTDGSGSNSIIMNEKCEIICDAFTRVMTLGEARKYDEQPLMTAAASEKDNPLQRSTKQQEQLDGLRGTVLALAAANFVAEAIEPGRTNTKFAGAYMKELTGTPANSQTTVSDGAFNPIQDELLDGNVRLFDALSYGESVNR